MADPAGFRTALAGLIRAHDVLRVKGFLDVPGRDRRQVVQAVGDRIEQHFDRPWSAGERRASRSSLSAKRASTAPRSRPRCAGSECTCSPPSPGSIADGSAAVDLAQTPGDIVVLASADTEIALLATAQARRRGEQPTAPSLRLAPVMRLGHNFSVDLYMETVAQARLVVARLLGGSGYWPYGVERLAETCRDHAHPARAVARRRQARRGTGGAFDPAGRGVPPAVALSRRRRPGQRRQFPALRRQPDRPRQREWAEPAPLLRAGLYWPDLALPSLADIAARWHGDGGGRADRVLPGAGAVGKHRAGRCAGAGAGRAAAAAAAGLCAQPEGAGSRRAAGGSFAAYPPAVILNATGFSVGRRRRGDDPLQADCPVLQIVFSGGDEASWRAGTRGLGPRDLAMNVALPEIDGRILSRAVSFKEPLAAIRRPRPIWSATARSPTGSPSSPIWRATGRGCGPSRRPSGGWRSCSPTTRTATAASATASGSTRRQSAVTMLRALRDAGYRTGDIPEDGAALMERLLAGPTNARPARAGRGDAAVQRIFGVFRQPAAVGAAAGVGALGRAERDPFFRPGGSIAATSLSPAFASAMSRC